MSLSPSHSSLSAAPLSSASDNVASTTSTPPTNFSDNTSVASDSIKVETTPGPESEKEKQELNTTAETPASGRSRRTRVGNPTYNISRLSAAAMQNKRGAGDASNSTRKKRNISGDTLVSTAGQQQTGSTDNLVRTSIDALNMDWTINSLETPGKKPEAQQESNTPRNTRSSTRLTGENAADAIVAKATSLGKRGRKAFESSLSKMSRELLRLQDTKEFAHIDDQPIVHTIWANGKYVTPEELEAAKNAPPRKKAKTDEAEKKTAEEKSAKKEVKEDALELHTRKGRRTKRWLEKGLYAGQPTPADIAHGLSTVEKKKLTSLPGMTSSTRVNNALPLPMFNGIRTLISGRDFKLPFDVCNPLPPGQPKPEHWTKISKNRFVGDSGSLWRKTPHFSVDGSKCICKPQDGCDEDCQNRIMLYECDDKNCNIGKERCTNRAFADLQERKAGGGKYRTGVEVIKTSDRGYGVRSNRCFEPNQIIMEYTGEIITEEECENRMNTKYKNNDCYYLMSFDQNMIIDATNGSIARFVNHSCKPNCRMIKWIVSGQPRMALFAGDGPIMSGDELTYDYNFDPFSAKNVQICLCGEGNCRGVLGPKPKDAKGAKADKADPKNGKKKSTSSQGSKSPKTTGQVGKSLKTPASKSKAATKAVSKVKAQVKAQVKSKAVKATKSSSSTTAKTKAVSKTIAKSSPQQASPKKAIKPPQKAKPTFKEAVKGVVKAGKRKLEELASDDKDEVQEGGSAKKRKIKAAVGVKQSYSSATSKVAKVAAKGAATVKKSVSTVTVNAKTAPAGKKTTSSKVTTVRMSSSGRVLKATQKREAFQQTTLSSRNSSNTMIEPSGNDENKAPGAKGSPKTPQSGKSARKSPASRSPVKSPRKAVDLPRANSKIRLVSPEATITARVHD